MTASPKLSEPQRLLLDKLRAGALLRHEVQERGLYRLTHGGSVRTVQTSTVTSLIANGILTQGNSGQVTIADQQASQ